MTFDPNLIPGQRLKNQEIMDVFGCGNAGGMRRATETKSLVLFTDHAKSLYDDRWDESGILHYTGMGKKGHQTLSSGNQTLNESADTGIRVFYFERFTGKATPYIYVGQVELTDDAYQEVQPDINGNARDVWVFPLRLLTGVPGTEVRNEELTVTKQERDKSAKKLSDQELTNRIKNRSKRSPGAPRRVSSLQHTRDQLVVEYALRRARGNCGLCREPAPFTKPNGVPFLEVHHIAWLTNGGPDTVDNVAALCPNCHRKMHSLNTVADQKKLKQMATEKLTG